MTPTAWWALVAVALRLALWWAARDAGVFADMEQYHVRAVALLQTGTLPDALRGPGYPLVLAAAYAVGGVQFTAPRLLQAALGGLLAAGSARLAALAGAGERAWVAAAIVAVYPGLLLSSVYLMPEGVYTVLIVGALLLALAAAPRVGPARVATAAAAGAVAGFAILTRSVGMAVLPALAALVAWMPEGRRRVTAALPSVAAVGVACILVLAPWLAFTTRVAGGPMLDATSGMNLLLGNHPGATGRLQMEDAPLLEQQFVAGATSVADGNARAVRAGLAWASAHPADWARLALRKLGWLFGLEGREHAWVYSVGYFGPRAPGWVRAWGVALIAGFPLLLFGACIGLARGAAWGSPARLAMVGFVGLTAALHVVSFGESRFHLPLVPMLAAWVAVGVAPADHRWSRGGTVVAAILIVLCVIAWTGQWPELRDRLQLLALPDGWQRGLPY